MTRLLLSTALLVVAVEAGAAGDSIAAGLLACKDVTDSAKRLECFDTLAEGVSQGQLAEDATPKLQSGDASPPALGDDVGKPQADDGRAEEYSAHVTSCERSDASGRWIFTFDNGQIWRQSNTGRLPFRECDFAVTLKRDVFGYKLEIPSEKRSVRVSRIK